MSDIISIVALLSTFILGILQWRSSVRGQASKGVVDRADAQNKIGSTYDELLENMRSEINELKEKYKTLKADYDNQEKRLRKFERWVPMLLDQIHQLGGVPVQPPDTDDLLRRK